MKKMRIFKTKCVQDGTYAGQIKITNYIVQIFYIFCYFFILYILNLFCEEDFGVPKLRNKSG